MAVENRPGKSREIVLTPVVLEGVHVRLEPLTLEHVEGLAAVGLDPEIWKWTPVAITSTEQLRNYVEAALAEQHRGTMLPFATVERASGKVVGTTRFGNIDVTNKRVEIGWTFVARHLWGSGVNSEVKLLQIRHAFEVWGCNRVEFKTDALNERSRAALKKLGAKEEGVLRQHMVCATGRLRDSVYFSIVKEEWPAVRDGLLARVEG